jgi:valyl-tRNA synthetase
MDKTFDAAEAEARIYDAWEAAGCFRAGANATPGARALLHHDPAAQRHRLAAHGPRLQQHAAGHPDALAPDARRRHALAAGHRPCRHRHPDGRRARTGRRRRASRRRDMGREEFLEHVWAWKRHRAARSSASSSGSARPATGSARPSPCPTAGFPRRRHQGLRRHVREGLIYRGKRLVNWDPHFETAISDLEVENVEVQGHMWHFKYPLAGGATYTYVEKDETGT